MPLNTLSKIMVSIERQWDIFEAFLNDPIKLPEFNSYLDNYRGLPNYSTHFSYKRQELGQESAVCAINFFINIFAIEGLADLPASEIEEVLTEIEKNVNLAIYYWYGSNDRNYQFRTWVHFFGLDGVSSIFLTKEKHDFAVTLCENGIRFSLANETRHPVFLPVSKILVFHEGLFLDVNKNPRELFARIRTIQREVCLLVDEWEYQNSILAVEFGQSKAFSQNQNQNQNQNKDNNEKSHQLILKKMDLKRNFLAKLTLESLCDFQAWVNLICKVTTNSDILSEIDALCALMLSSLQKLFLPASMSRLVYEENVICLFRAFILARLEYCPEDYSARLVLQAIECALDQNFNPSFNASLFHVMHAKPFEWILCFEPTSALKAFSWAYSKKTHTLLCLLMGVCYFKKCFANQLGEMQLSELLNAFQGQEEFLIYLKREAVPESLNVEEMSEIPLLTEVFLKYLETHIKKSNYSLECVEIIKNYVSLL